MTASEQPLHIAVPEVRDPVSRFTMAVVVAFFVLAGHIWSIDSGLWLDDHAHYEHLQKLDWSLNSAIEASKLGIVGEVLDLWGRHESGLKFFRPVAFWIMKIEYTVGHWSPMVMHWFSLFWHYLCSMLVGAVAMHFIGRRFWAMVAASLMAIFPGHTATVYWIACQTELVTTAFLLIGILAYAKHAGWNKHSFIKPTKAATNTPPNQRKSALNNLPPYQGGTKGGSTTIFGIIAVICYGLAIGCRENAILFPVVCVAGDWLCGTLRRKGIRWEHAAMIGVFVAYMVMRYIMLGGFPVPRKPYWMPISDPEFPVFIVQKVILYMLGLFGAVPTIPMGGRAFFTTRTTAFYGGFAALIAILLLILAVYRFRKSLLWPFVWAGVLIAPMLPVFASAHHLYLPSLGMVLLYTAGLAAIGGVLRPADYRMGRVRTWTCNLLLLTIAMALGTATWCSGFAYVRGTMAEDMLVDDVITRGRPIEEGDHLFFINLPPVCYYAVPAIKAELGLNQLNGHVLTCSPELVRMELPSEVELIDEHTLRVNSGPGQRYFEGITGQSLLAMMGFDGMPKQGETVDAGLFTVMPTIVDDQGVRELIFTFKQPLDSPNYHFYFGSPRFMAYPLDASNLKGNIH